MTTDLDALDRQVAELRGWKWLRDGWIREDTHWLAPRLRVLLKEIDSEYDMEDLFSPTRDARQAEVLLGELPIFSMGSGVSKVWCQTLGVHGEGDDWKHAVTRAWIAWKEGQ